MKKILIVAILIPFILSPLSADDELFKVFKLSYNISAFLDYGTTFQASRFPEYRELNPITKLYWREPSAFCAIKTIEIFALNELFDFVYRKNKVIGILTVAIFTAVRIWAVRDNSRAMRIR